MAETTQQIPGDDAQPPVPTSTVSPSPFDKPSADFVLRTADHVDFHIRRAILEEASVVFANMFADADGGPSGAPFVPLTECSQTIDTLLRMCYPVSDPEFASLDELKPVMEAARKYQMDDLMPTFTRRLITLSALFPLQAYALALQYGMEDTARVAAKHCLSLTHPWPYVAELERISGGAYFRLLDYQAKCAQTAQATVRSTVWLKDYRFTWLTCTFRDCPRLDVPEALVPGARDANDIYAGRPWFSAHLNRTQALLATRPSRSAVDHPDAYEQVVRDAADCPTCRYNILTDVRRFHAELANELEKRVCKVCLCAQYRPGLESCDDVLHMQVVLEVKL
ncbi:hypothetical protein TRAPUB_12087 [Trametes pubescens]|uniref:BTB domain-containing protein n=1 Tax=Trametes pubescens TaxID=154538 RepID=A0A1M2VV28_TRAPU|nr:hypothetical protein TRAPUB_12087 [Trametes pubescens]